MTVSTTPQRRGHRLITGVQPVHFLPNAEVVIDDRIATGDLANLLPETRTRLGGASSTLAAAPLSGSHTRPKMRRRRRASPRRRLNPPSGEPAALPPWAPWTEQPAVDGSSPAEGSAIDVRADR
jgi:hypothetical protein